MLALMYHAFQDKTSTYQQTGYYGNKYTVSTADFAKQVHLAQDFDVTFTFDDGHVSIYDLAYPLFYGRAKAIIFVTAGLIGTRDWLSKQHIAELADSGVTIGVHGWEHKSFVSLGAQQLECDLTSSRQLLEEISGKAVESIALVGGHYNRSVLDTIRRVGFQHVYSSIPGRGITKAGLIKRVWMVNNTNLPFVERVIKGGQPIEQMTVHIAKQPFKIARNFVRGLG